MLLKKALLLLVCCFWAVVAAGCATHAAPAGQPLRIDPDNAQYVNYLDDDLADALAGLMIAVDRLPDGRAVRRPDEHLVQRYVAGSSIENRPLQYMVLGQGPDVILILATIHGNEPAGTPLVLRLAQYLRQHPLMLRGRTAVIIPVANPDGMAHNRRFNANGVDLNRNFQTDNRLDGHSFGQRALSEPESRFIQMLIRQYRPGRIVSIHQPLTCIDYDGPAKALAECMVRYCDLPLRKLGAKPGSLGSYAGQTLSIPIVTFELPRDADRLGPDLLWTKYGNALVAAVLYPDLAK